MVGLNAVDQASLMIVPIGVIPPEWSFGLQDIVLVYEVL